MIQLSKREKLLAVVSLIFVVSWALFAFAVKPATTRAETLSRVIPEKQNELKELRAKSREYAFLRDNLDDLQARVASQGEEFELLPFLESLIQEVGLAKKVATMKQQLLQLEPNYYETIVEIRLENLTLEQLIDFLCRVESSNALAKVKSLHIKKSPTKTDLLESTIEIHNAKLSQSQIARR